MAEIKKLTQIVDRFRGARDWKQFHNPKDMTLSLVLEAAELMEHFQWKSSREMDEHIKKRKPEIAGELADVFYWVLLIAKDFKINLSDAIRNKIKIQEKKYPIEKAKGRHTKYTEL